MYLFCMWLLSSINIIKYNGILKHKESNLQFCYPSGVCDPENIFNDKCYEVVEEKGTYDQAEQVCKDRALSHSYRPEDAYLAIPLDEGKQDFVSGRLKKARSAAQSGVADFDMVLLGGLEEIGPPLWRWLSSKWKRYLFLVNQQRRKH